MQSHDLSTFAIPFLISRWTNRFYILGNTSIGIENLRISRRTLYDFISSNAIRCLIVSISFFHFFFTTVYCESY